MPAKPLGVFIFRCVRHNEGVLVTVRIIPKTKPCVPETAPMRAPYMSVSVHASREERMFMHRYLFTRCEMFHARRRVVFLLHEYKRSFLVMHDAHARDEKLARVLVHSAECRLKLHKDAKRLLANFRVHDVGKLESVPYLNAFLVHLANSLPPHVPDFFLDIINLYQA